MPEIHKSNTLRHGVFISYARSDGSTFAKDLRCRLIDEYHFQVWQDIVELEGGKDWWLQIETAIKSVEFLVMVMTPGALASQITRKEFWASGIQSVCIIYILCYIKNRVAWIRLHDKLDLKFKC